MRDVILSLQSPGCSAAFAAEVKRPNVVWEIVDDTSTASTRTTEGK